MGTALETTLKLLSGTNNEAAIGVLIPALDSPHPEIQEGALRAILNRKSPTGQREVLRRLHTINDAWRAIIEERRGRLSCAIRDAILNADRQMCDNGCKAVLWLREYDLMPTLVTASEDAGNSNSDQAAETAVALAELLSEQLSEPRDYKDRRDPQLVRRHLVETLEKSVERFGQHKRKKLVEALIILASRDSTFLKRILCDSNHVAYLVVIEILTYSTRPVVMRLLVDWLDDHSAPQTVLNVISQRVDESFVRYLANKVGFEPSDKTRANLQQLKTFAWARNHPKLLGGLDEQQQHAIVQTVVASGMKRLEAFEVIAFFMEHGNVGGRRAACKGLAEFTGDRANKFAMMAIEDTDPGVVAAAVAQLRKRGIPGAMSTLIDMVEHPHHDVRAAVRASLTEFSFDRFLAAYEMLDEGVRETTGKLVKKVDPSAIPAIAREMADRSRTRRLRALSVASAIDAVPELQSSVIELLNDEDHMVRTQAAKALAQCDTEVVREQLRFALGDRSLVVQEAAEKSLAMLDEARPFEETQEPSHSVETPASTD